MRPSNRDNLVNPCVSVLIKVFDKLVNIIPGPFNCITDVPVDDLPENSPLSISCSQQFTGRWAPRMRCHVTNHPDYWIYLNDASSNSAAAYQGIVLISHQLDGGRISCDVFYENPKACESAAVNEARNVPNMTTNWLSNTLNVKRMYHF